MKCPGLLDVCISLNGFFEGLGEDISLESLMQYGESLDARILITRSVVFLRLHADPSGGFGFRSESDFIVGASQDWIVTELVSERGFDNCSLLPRSSSGDGG